MSISAKNKKENELSRNVVLFVPTINKKESELPRKMVTAKGNQAQNKLVHRKLKVWVCHYCGKHGHIISFCYKLQKNIFSRQKVSSKQISTSSYQKLNIPSYKSKQ